MTDTARQHDVDHAQQSHAPQTNTPQTNAPQSPAAHSPAEGPDLRRPGRPAIDPRRARRALLAADVAAITIAIGVAFAIQHLVRAVDLETFTRQVVVAFATAPAWIVAIITTRLLDSRAIERIGEEFRRIIGAALFIVAAVVAFGFAVQFESLSRLWVGLLFITITTISMIERSIARALFARLRAAGRMQRRVVIIGSSAYVRELAPSVDNHGGYQLVGYLGDGLDGTSTSVDSPLLDTDSMQIPSLGHLDDAERILDLAEANGVIISLASLTATNVNRLARRLTDLGYHVALSSSLIDIDVSRLRTQQIDGSAMFYIEPTIRNGWRATAKRAFDITIAGATLVLAAPVLAVAGVAIAATSRGPVVFRQTRVGKDGNEFPIYKLRTMVQDAEQLRSSLDGDNEADGPLFKMTNDPRVTSVGRFLRTTSIDELPQCANVLLGHMSVVGPRPALPSEVEQWTPEVRERLRVSPGITGLWQVSGRSDAGFESYKRFDRYYVDNWSLVSDLRIVARTFGVVVGARGAR